MKRFLFATGICVLLLISAFKNDTPPTADQVLKTALVKAKKEKKHVLIIFHASWCGWCHKMDASINDPQIKPLFDKSYVIEHLTVLEHDPAKKPDQNPGAEDLMKKYNSEGFGIPLWFIFDANGKLIVDSHIRPAGTGFEVKGDNIIGCPASEEEVKAFVVELKKTSKLTDAELGKIAARFRKNDPKYKG